MAEHLNFSQEHETLFESNEYRIEIIRETGEREAPVEQPVIVREPLPVSFPNLLTFSPIEVTAEVSTSLRVEGITTEASPLPERPEGSLGELYDLEIQLQGGN